MGRNLSPVVRRELANLDKDAESRKMAIKALKTYVKDLDSKAIPQFLSQVSESKTPSFSSGEHTISLYEVLARVHGPNIVPQIDNIMSTIIKTLTSSAGSFPLHQACSKVVPAIARYAIEPTLPEDKKRFIIHSLCKPLLDSLLGTQESLAFGAALCLKSLVDSDNWRFASDEVVNEVCLRVAGALQEDLTQTSSHMGLVMALAKRNSFTVEAYARSLIRSGLRILDCEAVDGNSQKKFSAIQMVNFLMKCVDPRSIFSELQNVIKVLEKWHTHKMPFVRGAAFEALQTARMLASEKGSVTGSNFSRRDQSRMKDFYNGRVRSPVFASPESQTMDSFSEYGSLVDSPSSTGQVSCNFEHGGRPVNRKLCRNEDNARVDVSLKEGLYSAAAGSGSNGSRQYFEGFEEGEVSDMGRENSEVFSGFGHVATRDEWSLSSTPSPQRTHCQLSYDAIKIYTTPRKLLCSLQNSNDGNSDFSQKSATRIRSQVSSRLEWNPARKLDLEGTGNGFSDHLKHGLNDKDQTDEPREEEETNDSDSESVSNVAPMADAEVPGVISQKNKCGIPNTSIQKKRVGQTVHTCIRGFFFSILFILVAAILLAMLIDNQEESFNLVPT